MPIDNQNEIGLLKASANGDTASFEQIVSRYQGYICAVTYIATGDVEKSEELAHETFISAWRSLDQLKDLKKFRGWLATIARNVVRNSFRDKKSDIISSAANIDSVNESAVTADQTDEDALTDERKAIVEHALKTIPQKYREVIVLYYRQDQSIKQVAAQLELSEDAVKQRLSRGRKMLKDQAARMIETTISKTGPSKAFTAGVMGSVAALALKSAATASAAASVTTAGSASTGGAAIASTGGITAAYSTVTFKIVTAAAIAVIAIGGAVAYKNINPPESQSSSTLINDIVANSESSDLDALKTDDSDTPENDLQQYYQTSALNGQDNSLQGRQAQKTVISSDNTQSTPDDQQQQTGRMIKVYVTDKQTGKPMEKATVYNAKGLGSALTDENGYCQLRWDSKKDWICKVTVNMDGFVPMNYSIRKENSPGDEPVEVHYALEKGTEIGGVVRNAEGKELSDFNLKITVNNDEHMKIPENDVNQSVITDSKGRWSLDCVPEDLKALSLSTLDKNYSQERVWPKTDQDIQLLRDKEYVFVADKGYSIYGIVTDQSDNPLENARVQLGDYYHSRGPEKRMITGEDGTFSFDNLSVRRTGAKYQQVEGQGKVPVSYRLEYVTVTAKGFAPLTKEVFFKEKAHSLEVVMKEGLPICGRVVDTDGLPVAGATVRADEWRTSNRDDLRAIDWNTKTEKDGRFVWPNAPDHKLSLMISGNGYMTQKTKQVISSNEEYEFVLNENLSVTGQVIDSVTKEPIKRFSYRKYQGGYITTEVTIADAGGKFSTAFTEQGEQFSIAFKADGYKPTRSRKVMLGEQDVDLSIEMVPDSGIDGVIVDPNGLPLSGVTVIVPQGTLHLYDMKYDESRLRYHHNTLTDDQGRFHFDAVGGDKYGLLVLEDDGYVYISSTDFPKDMKFVLQPYARIKGYYYKGSNPAKNEKIRVDYPGYQFNYDGNIMTFGNLAINCSVKTDNNGAFLFDKLIPGEVRVLLKPYKNITITAGETKEVFFGGDGPAVTGTVLTPQGTPLNEEFGRRDISFQRVYETMPIQEEEFPLPDNHEAMSYGELAVWFTQYGNSEEGRQWVRKMEEKYGDLQGYYSCDLDNNGRFKVANVKPGRYLLFTKVRAWKEPEKFPRRCDYNKVIATASKIFVVPEFKTIEEMDKPVDLGTISCRKSPLSVGMKAPDFEIQKLRSKGKIRLRDYKGKKVLVNITNPALKEHYPDKAMNLQQACRIADSQDDISILNIAVELIPWDYMRKKMAAECKLPGSYGVALMHTSKIIVDYEIGELPESVLIAPDGTILWKGTPADELLEKLREEKQPEK
ncbi:MAG: sigma-70 family RNA polymerase sigma factor [Phycisphaerae bacterium]|nr:sigma-70 family RNA polymerase sigma factor [Phycisphaerae bacterium]